MESVVSIAMDQAKKPPPTMSQVLPESALRHMLFWPDVYTTAALLWPTAIACSAPSGPSWAAAGSTVSARIAARIPVFVREFIVLIVSLPLSFEVRKQQCANAPRQA
jgi:hypothetical protein